ncbi:MAG: DUF2075 domain-containing protein [Balneola sp.]|nr:DUF2075 domain-containing protein [Balneola sp.]MBO6651469.1 DUF2075 domain-containing protein [Balneola sp.]MBO6712494.1 DUF2075 domain-containing protein [Balneola sp.]MBO6801013.1 DUF2075 domain-containing protein [Balneola sp.]MBO6870685.1 DUF2075 domain-containing protein [Balneola sp.]
MIVYKATKESFTIDVESGVIEDRIEYKVKEKLNRGVSPSEKRSWQSSLFYMNTVLNDPEIPQDSGISIELQIPQTSKRIDFIISGHDEKERDNAVIIELKQWETAQKTNLDGIVKTLLGGGIRETIHPSYQAWSYACLLNDFNEAVYTGNIDLYPCAFLHNYESDGIIDDPIYDFYTKKAPVFTKTDITNLREFIKGFIKVGDQKDIIDRIENGRIRPSKMLADSLRSMLKGNDEFLMIDDQKLAFEYVIGAINSTPRDQKKVVIIEGGPGTGKSVVAINLLVKLIGEEKFVSYVSKNSAPRKVYSSLLSGSMTRSRIDNLFRSSGSFTETPENTFDALVVDEAHRLNEQSGLFRNKGENQIKELIHAANVTVFFLDENQKVHIHDIGDKEEIMKWSEYHNAEVISTELSSQFRCNGSDGYLAWLDHTLQIRETANTDLDELDYDFQVMNDPNEVFERIKEKNDINNKSRMVAGYCWDWVSKKDSEANDIVFPEYGFAKQWNLSDDGMLWLIKEESINEIGCIHTCQGLELDYVGVIIGPDFKIRSGKAITDIYDRSKNDRSVFGMKKMMKEDPESAAQLGDEIIKNTYRTLMTRGMKGCYIYCTDKETEEYFRTMISTTSNP